MKCEQFLETYSDYVDGLLDETSATACGEHEGECPSCSRYARVMREGVDLFRELPEAEPASDFTPRLQHRLYHVEDNIPWAVAHPGGSAAVLAVAAVGLLSLFWLPFATQIPVEVQFAPVAVDAPDPAESSPLFEEPPFLEPPRQPLLPATTTALFTVNRPRLVVPATTTFVSESEPASTDR